VSLPVHLVPSLTDVRVGSEVTVDGDEAHHAVAVRRLRAGERVMLTDGAGAVAVGVVSATGKRVFTVRAEETSFVDEPQPSVVAVQALAKGDRSERAIEMLTEVGVSRVVPWAAGRSVAVWKGERAVKGRARWQATAREAAKQSRRAWLPEVDELATTAEVAGLVRTASLAVVLHEAAATPLASLPVPGTGAVVVVIGPEGGLTDDEVSVLTEAGARSVRLGPEVLRTSTAGVAAVSALLARTSRWA
jgi:16S rRNA (uracil1498-N3)-methyltransferase